MKKLSGIFFALCLMCLLSVQADAQEGQVRLRNQHLYVPPPSQAQPRSVQAVAQWQSSPVQHIQTQGHQAVQEWAGSDTTTQQLQQFTQQTQQELSNFSKL